VAAELKAMLVVLLPSGDEVRLYLDQATELDVCILQLLWCADRQWRQAGKSLTLLGPLMDEVSAAIAGAGIEQLRVSSTASALCEV